MDELENEYLFITRLSTCIVENSYGSLDNPEEKFRQQFEKKSIMQIILSSRSSLLGKCGLRLNEYDQNSKARRE